jgi:hypothetical protein
MEPEATAQAMHGLVRKNSLALWIGVRGMDDIPMNAHLEEFRSDS